MLGSNSHLTHSRDTLEEKAATNKELVPQAVWQALRRDRWMVVNYTRMGMGKASVS